MFGLVGSLAGKIFGAGGWFAKNAFAKKLGGSILGGMVNRRFNRLGMRDQISAYRGLGLTPQEMVGAVGQTGSTTGNMLGNVEDLQLAQQARIAERQLNQQREIAELQSNTTLGVAQIQAEASIRNAELGSETTRRGDDIRAETSRYQTDTGRQNVLDKLAIDREVSRAQINKITAETQQLIQNTRFQAVLHSERWEKLFSSMSAENVAASALAVHSGVSIQKVLQNLPHSDAEKIKLQDFLSAVLVMKSRIRTETAGASSVIGQLGDRLGADGDQVQSNFRPAVDLILRVLSSNNWQGRG